MLAFRIYDKDCAKYSLENHDFLGKLECNLGEIVAAPHSKVLHTYLIGNSDKMLIFFIFLLLILPTVDKTLKASSYSFYYINTRINSKHTC